MKRSTSPVSRHVLKIADAMGPDPAKWHLAGVDEDGGFCECGMTIKYRYLFTKLDEPDRMIVIGSTCIHATVPWLQKMGATELAEAVEYALNDRPHLARLERALYLGALLDEWIQSVTEMVGRFALPEYFQEIGSIKRPWLAEIQDRVLDRAKRIEIRTIHCYDRIPLLKKAVEKRIEWSDPPQNVDPPQGWLDLRLRAEELRAQIRAQHRELKPRQFFHAWSLQLTEFNGKIPVKINALRNWVAEAERTLGIIPDIKAHQELCEQVEKLQQEAVRATSELRRYRKAYPALFNQIQDLAETELLFSMPSELRNWMLLARATLTSMSNAEAHIARCKAAEEVFRRIEDAYAFTQPYAERFPLAFIKLEEIYDERIPVEDPDYLELWIAEAEEALRGCPSASVLESLRRERQEAEERAVLRAERERQERGRRNQQRRHVEKLMAERLSLGNELSTQRERLVDQFIRIRSGQELILSFEEKTNPSNGRTELEALRDRTVYVVAGNEHWLARPGIAFECRPGRIICNSAYKTVRIVHVIKKYAPVTRRIQEIKTRLAEIEQALQQACAVAA